MTFRLLAAIAAVAVPAVASAAPVLAPPAELGADVQQYVRVPAGQIAITPATSGPMAAAVMERKPPRLDPLRVTRPASTPSSAASSRTIARTSSTAPPDISPSESP